MKKGQLLIHLVQTGDGKRLQEALLQQEKQQQLGGGAQMEAVPAEYSDENGYTPLHWAAHCDEAVMVANLIRRGNADPKARTKRGETFIHRAAARNALRVLRALRIRSQEEDGGAKHEKPSTSTSQNSSGRTAIVVTPSSTSCIVPINKDVLEARNTWNEQPLHIAASGGHKPVLEALILLNADVNAVDKWGRTPLKVATENGEKVAMEYLKSIHTIKHNNKKENAYATSSMPSSLSSLSSLSSSSSSSSLQKRPLPIPPPPPPPLAIFSPLSPCCTDNSNVADLSCKILIDESNETAENKKKVTEEIIKVATRMRGRRRRNKAEEERKKRNDNIKANTTKKYGKEKDEYVHLNKKKMEEAKNSYTRGGKGPLKAQQEQGLRMATNRKKKALSKHIEYPGDLEFIRNAVESKEFDLAGRDMFGLTALHKFASWNKTDLIEEIAPKLTKPQLNQQTPKEKDTALHLAVKMGAARAVLMLASLPKIDILIRNKNNETALELAQGIYGRSDTCEDDGAPISQIILYLSSAFKRLSKKNDSI